ncbi:MAG: GIY-YIG nuclease family protein [Geobacter sp.]|nr:GIY-YIG nuclease family protein [Geobacter sp.]
MNFGRKITIYLADGTPSGIRHVEIVNWSGQAIYSPRSRFADLTKWEETKRPGVYFLFEKQSADTENRVYIGESENVIKRLNDHVRQKDFWNELVIFTSKDENLTKSHIKYLEARLTSLATQAERYKIENSNTPPESSLPRADKDTMEEFISNMRIVLGTLGHKVLEPLKVIASSEEQKNKKTIAGIPLSFSLKNLKAFGQVTDDGFILLAGSDVSAAVTQSLAAGWRAIREKWIEEGILKQTGENFRLEKDALVSSSSCAAAIVAGTTRSGPQSWIDDTGRTLKAIEEQMIAAS